MEKRTKDFLFYHHFFIRLIEIAGPCLPIALKFSFKPVYVIKKKLIISSAEIWTSGAGAVCFISLYR